LILEENSISGLIALPRNQGFGFPEMSSLSQNLRKKEILRENRVISPLVAGSNLILGQSRRRFGKDTGIHVCYEECKLLGKW